MHYLPYWPPVDTEVTLEKLDNVAKKLSGKILSFLGFFGVFFGWGIFNVLIALFVDRTRSLSLDTYRLVAEELRGFAAQDIFFVLSLIFDNKIDCVISLAMIFACEVAFVVRVLNLGGDDVCEDSVNKYAKDSQFRLQNEAYVVSYKQQVAFLA